MSVVRSVSSLRDTGARIQVHDDGQVRCRALRSGRPPSMLDGNAPVVYQDAVGNTVAQFGIDGTIALAGQERKARVPRLASVTPAQGKAAGGDTVTISGADFTQDATVTFNGVAGAVTFVSTAELTVVTPAGTAGDATVEVGIPNHGSHARTDVFEYWAAPTIGTLTPSAGNPAGGDALRIDGTGFQASATVTIGGVAATSVIWRNLTRLDCVTPAGSLGASDVVVTNIDGQQATSVGGFTYSTGASVASVVPNHAHHQGGVALTVTGSGFLAGAAVTLGGQTCTSIVVASANTITCQTPALPAGLHDLVVTNPSQTPGALADAVEVFTREIIVIASGATAPFADQEGRAGVWITELGDLRTADRVRLDR